MNTLQELINELGLKPYWLETVGGRSKTKNGYSHVYIIDDDYFITFDKKSSDHEYRIELRYQKYYVVRG